MYFFQHIFANNGLAWIVSKSIHPSSTANLGPGCGSSSLSRDCFTHTPELILLFKK